MDEPSPAIDPLLQRDLRLLEQRLGFAEERMNTILVRAESIAVQLGALHEFADAPHPTNDEYHFKLFWRDPDEEIPRLDDPYEW